MGSNVPSGLGTTPGSCRRGGPRTRQSFPCIPKAFVDPLGPRPIHSTDSIHAGRGNPAYGEDREVDLFALCACSLSYGCFWELETDRDTWVMVCYLQSVVFLLFDCLALKYIFYGTSHDSCYSRWTEKVTTTHRTREGRGEQSRRRNAPTAWTERCAEDGGCAVERIPFPAPCGTHSENKSRWLDRGMNSA